MEEALHNYTAKPLINKESKTSWGEKKKQLKRIFIQLTDADLAFSEGTKEKMLLRLQAKLGRSKDELEKLMAGF